jgi:hypothetical protein
MHTSGLPTPLQSAAPKLIHCEKMLRYAMPATGEAAVEPGREQPLTQGGNA